MSLVIDNQFLVGSHSEGFLTVINAEECSVVDTISSPFGEVENTWGVEVLGVRPEGEPQVIFIPTTNGLYQCSVTPQGQLIYLMESYYEGFNVTNSVLLNEDEMLVSLERYEEDENGQESSWYKLVILDLDTRGEKIVIAPEAAVNILDICKIPCFGGEDENPYFIMHTGKGLQLVNPSKLRSYDLAMNAQTNFNVCRSIAVIQIDPDDDDQGFWLG